jgi:hypothetical protein
LPRPGGGNRMCKSSCNRHTCPGGVFPMFSQMFEWATLHPTNHRGRQHMTSCPSGPSTTWLDAMIRLQMCNSREQWPRGVPHLEAPSTGQFLMWTRSSAAVHCWSLGESDRFEKAQLATLWCEFPAPSLERTLHAARGPEASRPSSSGTVSFVTGAED